MPRLILPALFVLLLAAPAVNAAGQVPAWLIEVPASVKELLIADTSSASLRRFEVNGRGIVQKDDRYMSIGKKGVGKERAWDRRTPLGIYFITEELDTRRLHDKYGDKAFVLDYPNAWDRYKGRTGDGIWLHGVDRNEPDRPALDTDGCLALPNEDINALAPDLRPLQTPLIVARDMDWVNPGVLAPLRRALRGALDDWQRALAAADVDRYLALYAEDFRHRGMAREDWAAWRRAVLAERGPARLRLNDVLLLADPEEPGLYLARFEQVLDQEGAPLTTMKRLYFRRAADGSLRIVAEDNG